MIEEPKKLTIKSPDRRPTDAQIAAFQGVPTGFVVDAMYGTGALAPEVSWVGAGQGAAPHVAGPALTVDNRPSDILALLAALYFIRKGDVVVNAFAGCEGCAAAGDRVSGMMKNCGAAGFVTDGPMRDLSGIMAVGLPSWCTGLNPNSPFGTGPGKVGLPVNIAGQRVETGDMIVADADGVVVVPFAQVAAVSARIAEVAALEHALDAEVDAGLSVPDDIKEVIQSDDVTWIR